MSTFCLFQDSICALHPPLTLLLKWCFFLPYLQTHSPVWLIFSKWFLLLKRSFFDLFMSSSDQQPVLQFTSKHPENLLFGKRRFFLFSHQADPALFEACMTKTSTCVLRSVWLSATPWTVTPRLLCPWHFPGKNTGVGRHFLLQGNILTQGSNPGLLHCRQILYWLGHQGTNPSQGSSSQKTSLIS